jgi:hypothetical protein
LNVDDADSQSALKIHYHGLPLHLWLVVECHLPATLSDLVGALDKPLRQL